MCLTMIFVDLKIIGEDMEVVNLAPNCQLGAMLLCQLGARFTMISVLYLF